MNKKRIRRFIAFLCVAVTIACQMSFAFADTMNETDILLAGFSYSMDGSEIESEYRYSMSATAYEYADRLELVNPVLLFGEQELPFPSRVTLEKQNESMFSTYIPWLNLSMIIETNHSEYYIDVFSEEVCIALFGKGRTGKGIALRCILYLDSRCGFCFVWPDGSGWKTGTFAGSWSQ